MSTQPRQVAETRPQNQTALFKCTNMIQPSSVSIMCIRFNPAGSQFAIAGSDSYISIYTLDCRPVTRLYALHIHGINSIDWSPCGRYVVAGSDDGFVSVWDTLLSLPIHLMRGHTHHVLSVAWSPNENIIASGSLDETVCLWDFRTGSLLRQNDAHTNAVTCVTFTPDGSALISSGLDGLIRIWDIHTGYCSKTLQAELTPAVGSISTLNGIHLVASHLDSTVRVWDLVKGVCIRILVGHTNTQFRLPVQIMHPIHTMQPYFFSHPLEDKTKNKTKKDSKDDQSLDRASNETKQDKTDGKSSKQSKKSSSPSEKNQQSHLSEYIPSARNNISNTITLEDEHIYLSGLPLRHPSFIAPFVVAPSEDGSLCFWDPQQGLLLRRIKAHRDIISAIAIHPSKAIIISVGMDKDLELKIWSAEPLVLYEPSEQPYELPTQEQQTQEIQPPQQVDNTLNQASHTGNDVISHTPLPLGTFAGNVMTSPTDHVYTDTITNNNTNTDISYNSNISTNTSFMGYTGQEYLIPLNGLDNTTTTTATGQMNNINTTSSTPIDHNSMYQYTQTMYVNQLHHQQQQFVFANQLIGSENQYSTTTNTNWNQDVDNNNYTINQY